MRRLLPLSALCFAALAAAQPAPPLTLDRVMADPGWIGPPVERAWWSWDGQRAYYNAKRDGATTRDTFEQPIAGGPATLVDGAARAAIDAPQPVFDAARTRMAFVRSGDVFVRDLRSGALQQLTRSQAEESQPQWSRDGGLAWRDPEGALHLHSAMCPHLGCVVHWNPVEHSWDCPCHGSRFAARDGSRLNGPADRGLAPVEMALPDIPPPEQLPPDAPLRM